MDFSEVDHYAVLEDAFLEHGSLFVAFDFDNTVFDYHNEGIDYTRVIDLLKDCKSIGFKLILFTSNEGDNLENCIAECNRLNIQPMYVNSNPVFGTREPYYNILLDDKAGLLESFNRLEKLIKNHGNQEI
jgi:hypothetical protein